MSALDNDQLGELSTQLLALRAELQHLLDDGEAARPVDLDQQRQGRVSRIDAIQQQQMARAGRAVLEQQLRQVLSALRRLDDDDYGWCEHCGEPIAFARLKVRPEAPLCIACQSKQESE
jgi:DnaK suppressor protein